jgi:hypothetical protein
MDRRLYIGSSDAAPVMGHGYLTPKQLLRYKRGEYNKPPILLRDIHRGNTMEPIVVDMIKEEHDSSVNTPRIYEKYDARPDQKMEGRDEKQIFLEDAEHPYIGGHPDALGDEILWEIKCPRQSKVARIADDGFEFPTLHSVLKSGIPTYWWCQVQHLMMISGHEVAKIAVFDYDQWDIIIYDVEPAPQFQRELRKRYEILWSAVHADTAPEFLFDEFEIQRDVDEHKLKTQLLLFDAAKQNFYEAKKNRKLLKSKVVDLLGGEGTYTGEDFHVMCDRVDVNGNNGKYHYYKLKYELS